MDKAFLIIDLKAFYASVECRDRNLDPFSTPLVVADKSRSKNTIVLSVSPFLKSLGIPSRCRLYELPDSINYIFATPRMQQYLIASAEVVDLILDYFGEDDIHVYSIDELFIDYTPYKRLYKKSPLSMAKFLKQQILEKLGLYASIGIGPNMFLAKSALDLEAKKRKDGIACWNYEDVQKKLYPISPLSKMFGISHALEKRLNNLGLISIGDLAQCPKELLIEKFGIIGEELFEHANGIDTTEIREKYNTKSEHFQVGQVLKRNYQKDEIPLIVREMSDELSLRLQLSQKFARSLSIHIGYSQECQIKPLSQQITLNIPTDNCDVIFETYLEIINKNLKNFPIRTIHVSALNIFHPQYEQLDIFSSFENNEKEKSLRNTIINIKNKYGQNAILRGTSSLSNSTVKERHNLIGGHHK